MEPKKIWTAAELDEMSPEERKRIFDESIVWDLDDAPNRRGRRHAVGLSGTRRGQLASDGTVELVSIDFDPG